MEIIEKLKLITPKEIMIICIVVILIVGRNRIFLGNK